MGLPVLQLPVHVLELPISKRKIKYRPFVLKEEKSLLTSINTENKEDVLKMFNLLVENCILEDGFEVRALNLVDFFYLLLHIRMKSTGENIDGNQQCAKCKKTTEFSVNLEDSIVIENSDCVEALVQVNEKLAVKIVPPKMTALFDSEDHTPIDILASGIETVIYEEEVHTGFTTEQLITNILSNIPKLELDKISDGMENLATMSIKFNYVCNACAHVNEYKTQNISDVF
jgi:hypothetical protein